MESRGRISLEGKRAPLRATHSAHTLRAWRWTSTMQCLPSRGHGKIEMRAGSVSRQKLPRQLIKQGTRAPSWAPLRETRDRRMNRWSSSSSFVTQPEPGSRALQRVLEWKTCIAVRRKNPTSAFAGALAFGSSRRSQKMRNVFRVAPGKLSRFRPQVPLPLQRKAQDLIVKKGLRSP